MSNAIEKGEAMPKKLLQRVYVQVAILVVTMIAFTGILIFYLTYSMSYREMINMLESNVNTLALHIEDNLNTDIFTEIKTKEDMSRQSYDEAHIFLDTIRTMSKIKYLYTATLNDTGDLVYHVDGLPYGDADFRNVGDLIDVEFQAPLLAALNNEIVMHEDILNTEWGNVFVAYYPLHDSNGNVVAALGIEFPADNQHKAFQNIRLVVSLVMIIICIISGYLARYLFTRISNPYFKDLYNTDSLTKLKNRAAFDTDVYNDIQRHRLKGVVLVITDLNGLKPVNDKYGHKMGDFYINACATALIIEKMNYCIVYRIGGDEFATLIPSEYSSNADSYIELVRKKLSILCNDLIPPASVSMGYAVCSGVTLEAWEKTYQKADEAMYLDKREYYKKHKSLDGRK